MASSETPSWTIAKVIAWASADLRKRGVPSPRLDAELLLGHVLGCGRVELIVDAERPLAEPELGAYRELHRRRRTGEPVAYLTGVREFYGRLFRVDRRVLIPRPETELLVEVGLARTRSRALSARVLDLGTGSGCVAITIAQERPTNWVLATDRSADALAVAEDNALRLGASIRLARSDLYAALGAHRHGFDLIAANPPYIAEGDWPELPPDVRDFEPRLALAAGAEGLDVLAPIIAGAADLLAPGGVLALEVGAGQAARVQQLCAQAGLDAIEAMRDYGGHPRVVSARWEG